MSRVESNPTDGNSCRELVEELGQELAEYQFCLADEETGAVVAEAHTGPLAWSGDDADLPPSIDDADDQLVQGEVADRRFATLMPRFTAQSVPAGRRPIGLQAWKPPESPAGVTRGKGSYPGCLLTRVRA
jgi:hypothetical protein